MPFFNPEPIVGWDRPAADPALGQSALAAPTRGIPMPPANGLPGEHRHEEALSEAGGVECGRGPRLAESLLGSRLTQSGLGSPLRLPPCSGSPVASALRL